MKEPRQITMKEYTELFWDSMDLFQRSFISLTQNHRKIMPINKNWNKLTKYQQQVIFKFLWRDVKPIKRIRK